MLPRIKKLRAKLKQNSLDGLLVSSAANVSYLTDSLSRDAYLLVSANKIFYFTDARYSEEVKETLKNKVTLKIINGSVFRLIAQTCLKARLKRIGFEERLLAFAEYRSIKRELKLEAKLIPTIGLVEEIRQIKEPRELEIIKQAVFITQQALGFIKNHVKPGKKEIEIVAELEHFIRYHGSLDSAFQIIVASGPNSRFPHHISGPRIIRDNELVLIDIGVEYLGYKSDLTRAFFVGKISLLTRKIYDIVRRAQAIAIKNIIPGAKASQIDKACRDYISASGFANGFNHSLGHAIGLEVHEDPRLSRKDDTLLEPGMVFTVEPAIYLPGKFGIRIEDMVAVTKKGAQVLSGSLD
ncbi:MAG: Xaa-Pro peptidase family protein [Candidatus Omnitrophota bacterium]